MKKITLFIFFCLQLVYILKAQENSANQWYFGINAGVDFATGIPVVKTDGQLSGWEGCATVGDINGNLLFYTDGQNVFNRNHNIMQNGSGLLGNLSATQSSIIVPYPNNDSLFYIFTVDAMENHLQNGLRYSIVNMNLDGGLGGLTSVKNILLETPVAEKIISVKHLNNIDVWVISHRWNSDEFVAYEVSTSGINTVPVVTSIGTVHQGGYSSNSYNNGWANSIGQLKASKEGTKIALSIYKMNKFELFDFDRATGYLSNFQESPDVYTNAYGVEFSPNANYLYASLSPPTGAKTYQFDITQTDAFNNPYTIFPSGGYHRSLQTAPNGKIYMGRYNYGYLDVINNPNEYGSGSNPVEQEIYLLGNISNGGLPNLFYYKGFQFFTGSELDASICEGDSIFLESGWQTIAETYYDTLISHLGWDSIVNIHLEVLPILPNPIITEEFGNLNSTYANNYQWYLDGDPIAGAINQEYHPVINGSYQVATENNNNCLSFSEVYVFLNTGINKSLKNKYEIYPNPTSGKISIKNSNVKQVEIYNFRGVLVQSSNKREFDLGQETKGIYFVKFITKEGIFTEKIVLE